MPEESLLQFPCEFPIKVIGREYDGFAKLAQSLVEPFTGRLEPTQIRQKRSQNGRFLAITFTITATNQEQLDNIYRALSGHDDMLVVL